MNDPTKFKFVFPVYVVLTMYLTSS